MNRWKIMREPGPAAYSERRSRERRFSMMLEPPRPKQVAVVQATTQSAALRVFVAQEEKRSKHVNGWHVSVLNARGDARLVVTLQNGYRNIHEAVYHAWMEER